jgi:hypothetical protein
VILVGEQGEEQMRIDPEVILLVIEWKAENLWRVGFVL